jgi:hypothetical protein
VPLLKAKAIVTSASRSIVLLTRPLAHACEWHGPTKAVQKPFIFLNTANKKLRTLPRLACANSIIARRARHAWPGWTRNVLLLHLDLIICLELGACLKQSYIATTASSSPIPSACCDIVSLHCGLPQAPAKDVHKPFNISQRREQETTYWTLLTFYDDRCPNSSISPARFDSEHVTEFGVEY